VVADLNQIWRRKELHARGVPEDGVGQGSLVEHSGGESLSLGFDGARKPDWTGANDQEINHVRDCTLLLTGVWPRGFARNSETKNPEQHPERRSLNPESRASRDSARAPWQVSCN